MIENIFFENDSVFGIIAIRVAMNRNPLINSWRLRFRSHRASIGIPRFTFPWNFILFIVHEESKEYDEI